MNDNHEPAPSIFIEDLDAIIPMVLKVNRRMHPAQLEPYTSYVELYATLEHAQKGYPCIADDFEISPLAEMRIESAIKAQSELARRHRALDESLNDTLRSIMSVSL